MTGFTEKKSRMTFRYRLIGRNQIENYISGGSPLGVTPIGPNDFSNFWQFFQQHHLLCFDIG